MKRTLDRFISLIGLLCPLPVLLLIAIKMPCGPVLFTKRRVKNWLMPLTDMKWKVSLKVFLPS